MGRPKLLLPWGERTVLGEVLHRLADTAVADTMVVTGHQAEAVAEIAAAQRVRTVHNDQAVGGGEMITSLQTAVRQHLDL